MRDLGLNVEWFCLAADLGDLGLRDLNGLVGVPDFPPRFFGDA